MSTSVWISILTLAVGSTITLIVAAMHRRQMRQIELHRSDPSVPLKPPPHPLTQFLARNANLGVFLVTSGTNLTFLVRHLYNTDSLTRTEVFAIAVFTGGLYFSLAMFLMTRNIVQVFVAMGGTRYLLDKIGDVLGELTRAVFPAKDKQK